MITLRIDVDYANPSRIKSFILTAMNLRLGRDYLKNAKIIARMINESTEQVKAVWFFTPTSLPDEEVLKLLENDKHEIALHIANDPDKELKRLEEVTGRKSRYYTVHGVDRSLARIIWRRWKSKNPKVSISFPLSNYKDLSTKEYGLDVMCYANPPEQVIRTVKKYIQKDYILHIHPEWLFERGKMNRRGRFYEVLKEILKVDKELVPLYFRRKLFLTIARDWKEYERDLIPTRVQIDKIRERGADIFTFLERKWCCRVFNPSKSWAKTPDNIALLHLTSYSEWWDSIGKKTRNMIRKAEKSGIRTDKVQSDESLAQGMWGIYNETPIRQERAFPHYGISLETVKKGLSSVKNATYIGAYLENELVGFIQLVHGENVAIISQILSLQKHWDKAVNNALVARAIEVCASEHFEWIMYGRMGNHPSLDNFKQNHGFTKYQLTRYFIPLTRKGKLAIRLGLHRDMKDALPQAIKYPLIPVYNWVSRAKVRIRAKPKQIT